AASIVLGLFMALLAPGAIANASTKFSMVVSAGAKSCVPNARGTVRISAGGSVETMSVAVDGLPASAKFGLFVVQVPKAPSGVSFYEGTIKTNRNGRGHQHFTGT